MTKALSSPILQMIRSVFEDQRVRQLSDQELLKQFSDHRDEAAFHAILNRHGGMVLEVCRGVLGNETDAEDAFQATFLILAGKAASIRKMASVGSWLHGVAYRTALKAWGQLARRQKNEARMPARQVSEPDDLTWREVRQVLHEELSRLPERYRLPLVVCYLEGRTQAAAAAQLGLASSTLKERLERGRSLLRARLVRRGLGPAAVLFATAWPVLTASACLPTTLVNSTIKAALFVAAGGALASVVPAKVAALSAGVLNAMFARQLKLVAAFLLLAGALSTGAWIIVAKGFAAQPEQEQPEALDAGKPAIALEPVVVQEDGKDKPRRDSLGDPLPDGAVARFGSIRFRHAGLADHVLLADGKTVLTAGRDRVLRFWDIASGNQVRAVRLQGKAGYLRHHTLSPDGKTLVAQDQNHLVFWNVDSGKEIKRLTSPSPQELDLFFLCFAPDGKTLAVSSRRDQLLSLWDWQKGTERELVRTTGGLSHGSFSSDGKRFVAGADSKEGVRVFEVATGRQIHRIDCCGISSTVSPDGQRLAVSSRQNDNGQFETAIRLFDLASGKQTAKFPVDTKDQYFFRALAFSPDGKVLACGRSDDSFLLDLATGRVLHRLPGDLGPPRFTADGKSIAVSADCRLRFWDVATGKERADHPGDFGHNMMLAVSPDGMLLAAGDTAAQAVNLWDTVDGRVVRRLPLKRDELSVCGLAFAGDGKTLVIAQGLGLVNFWDVANGTEQRCLQLRQPVATDFPIYDSFHVSRDGKNLYTVARIHRPDAPNSWSSQSASWDAASGKPVFEHGFRREFAWDAWSADGRAATVWLKDGVELLELPSGVIRFRIPGIPPFSGFSPDDRLIVGRKPTQRGADPETSIVCLWEAATGKEVAAVAVGRVGQWAMAPDNRSLITTDEKFLRVWDLATGKERRRWALPEITTEFGTVVRYLMLSPDGRRAFTVLYDESALAWDLTAALRPAEPLAKHAGEMEIAAWWTDLAADDAGRAYAAIWRLAEAPPDAAVALLRKHLKPAMVADQEIRQLIADLDSETFAVRDKAFKRLDDLGEAAQPALRETLDKNPPLEVRRRLEMLVSGPQGLIRAPEVLRLMRAIQVLERIASKEARSLLAELSRGMPHAASTREALASLDRLARRPAVP